MTSKTMIFAAALIASTASCGGLSPIEYPAMAAEAEAADAAAIVAEARKLVRQHYVLPETAAALDKALGDAARNGRFKGLEGPALAEAINAVMRQVTADGHLMVGHDPGRSADLAAHADMEGPSAGNLSPVIARMIALNNAGFRRMEVLPGNIRYVDYTGFSWGTPEAEAALAQAMEFLRGGSAIIIDLRRNGGGSAEAVAQLASYFLPENTELMRFEQRGEPVEVARTAKAPFSLAGRPAYVLIGQGSFSAAEEFAAHVDAFGFATLIGEKTRGGGFNNRFFALPGGHVISISTGKATHAKTGKGWEQTGITPKLTVAPEHALETAQAEAVEALIPAAGEGEKQALAAMLPLYRALAAGTRAELPLANYAGRYGDWLVEQATDGGLTVRRQTSPAMRLVPIGGHAFAPEFVPAQRFTFEAAAGTVAAVQVMTPHGPVREPRG